MPPVYLTTHFKFDELCCKDGCGLIPAEEFLFHLEALRVTVGHPMTITSGARCAWHNQRVAKTGATGPHVPQAAYPDYGAVDFLVHGAAALDFLRLGPDQGWFGYGLQQAGPLGARWMHADNWKPGLFPRPALWTYRE